MKFNPQIKLVRHPELLSYIEGKTIVPINIEISPSGICDAKCPWCFYRSNQNNKLLDADVLTAFLSEAINLGVKSITWTGGGEPTLHPQFKNFTICNIEQGLITNGLRVPRYNPTIFSWIRVSKTDEDWNESALEKIRMCKSVGLCINYIGNEQEIEDSLKMVYKFNLDYLQVRPALNINGNTTHIPMPQISDKKLLITQYKFDEMSKPRTYTKCEGFHFVPFLWETGELDVCAYKRGNKNYNLGNIYNNTLSEILKNFPSYVNVESDCQVCCKNHEINTLISTLKSIEDINFV